MIDVWNILYTITVTKSTGKRKKPLCYNNNKLDKCSLAYNKCELVHNKPIKMIKDCNWVGGTVFRMKDIRYFYVKILNISPARKNNTCYSI